MLFEPAIPGRKISVGPGYEGTLLLRLHAGSVAATNVVVRGDISGLAIGEELAVLTTRGTDRHSVPGGYTGTLRRRV